MFSFHFDKSNAQAWVVKVVKPEVVQRSWRGITELVGSAPSVRPASVQAHRGITLASAVAVEDQRTAGSQRRPVGLQRPPARIVEAEKSREAAVVHAVLAMQYNVAGAGRPSSSVDGSSSSPAASNAK